VTAALLAGADRSALPAARASIIARTSDRDRSSWNCSGSKASVIVSMSIFATFISFSMRLCRRTEIERRLVDDFVGEVHQLEHERVAVGFERRKVFARADHDLRDPDLVPEAFSASRSSA
jgi:hypothetical protein